MGKIQELAAFFIGPTTKYKKFISKNKRNKVEFIIIIHEYCMFTTYRKFLYSNGLTDHASVCFFLFLCTIVYITYILCIPFCLFIC